MMKYSRMSISRGSFTILRSERVRRGVYTGSQSEKAEWKGPLDKSCDIWLGELDNPLERLRVGE